MSEITPMATPFDQPEDGFQAIRCDGYRIHLLDQRRLPQREVWLESTTLAPVIDAIRDLVVRGAPAIGITAAYGAVIAAREAHGDPAVWRSMMEDLKEGRPTAVNLAWAIDKMLSVPLAEGALSPEALMAEARRIHREDIAANRAMAEAGHRHIGRCQGVITHCNTGSLATGGVGTALGVIIAGARAGLIEQVYADETRPWLQGSRLTAWELAQAQVPARVIVDGAAAALMASGRIGWVIVGSDRIAANGDVANKIGTYGLAVAARHHGVKFMVVAPRSTVDPAMASGAGIEIEQRAADEIWRAAGLDQAPEDFEAWNPVFDVTPADLVDCIVTEEGVHRPPFDFSR
jgi:methylthioribose-1-phosphate isomerase